MKSNNKFYKNTQRGASLLEVILAIALSIMLIPFMYVQLADMNNAVKDIAVANRIAKSRDGIINYIRMNQAYFPDDEHGSPLYASDLENVAPGLSSFVAPTKIENGEPVGWVFKINTQGSEITEVFLAFSIGSDYQTADIAKYIGNDAAIVTVDQDQNLVAYSQNWAIGVGEDFYFYPGDLIFRISHNFGGDDKNKFLHRGTLGGDGLNVMHRNLHMNNFNIYNVAQITGNQIFANSVHTNFIHADLISANTIQFKQGAEIQSGNAQFRSLYVDDDIVNFTTINTKRLECSEMESKDATIDTLVNISTTGTGAMGNLVLSGGTKFYFENVEKVSELFSGYTNTGILKFNNDIMVSDDMEKTWELDGEKTSSFVFSYVWKWPNPDNVNKPSAPSIQTLVVKYMNASDILDIESKYLEANKFDYVLSDKWYK